MSTKPMLRAGSLFVALAATAFLVLHACSAAKRPGSMSQAAAPQAGGGAVENGGATATTTATATATATANEPAPAATEESAPEYFPATKAGIVLAPKKSKAPSMQQAANAKP